MSIVKVKVLLNQINAIKEFVNIMIDIKNETIIRSGKFVVDAKSIMGIFSLDLTKPVELEIVDCDDDNILKLISDFIVKED